MVKLLISYNAKIDMTDVNGWTALRIACNYGQASATVLRLEEDIRVSIKHKDTPSLKIHSKPQYDEIVSYLIKNDADVNLVDKYGWTCLMSACQYGPTNIVDLLSSKVDNINKANNTGWTALHITCIRGDTDVAELLLRCNADINRANSRGWTSLKIASLVGHKDIVELLLRKGADVNIEDTDEKVVSFIAKYGKFV
ncbi:protein fem-1 homolog A-like [Mytilus californianus]|uniref:protein fem-1 homolog A-like n=1 Tax=Mytilus californianus TaxID=6549 RepID=UPI00224761FD|nr:protein fem-1 homolog A-like [Mytilus californianus]